VEEVVAAEFVEREEAAEAGKELQAVPLSVQRLS